MFLKTRLAMAALALAATGAANADTIPYPDPGTANPATYLFTATTTGDLTAYFVGSGASYEEDLGLFVNGVDTGIHGLDDKQTAVGTALAFGHVEAGDVLTLVLRVQTTGTTFYSTPGLNPDGANHVYSAAYAGGNGIPAGTYVGFEDVAQGSDFNYADEQFVLTNTSAIPAVPEPSSLPLSLAGLGLVVAAGRRRGTR